MPDKIVKTVETVITARDDSAAGIKSYEDRLKKMANDVPAYVSGKSANDQQQLDRMRKFYSEQAQEAEKLRQVNRTRDEQDIRDLQAKKIRAMREAARLSRINSEADTRLFGDRGGLEPAGEEAGKQMAAGTEKGFLDSLNARFGKGSTAGKVLKLLKGSGAVFAIGIAAREFAAFAGAIKNVNEELATGQIKADELSEKFVQSVPIIGNIYNGLKDTALVMTGIAGDAARFSAEAKSAEESYASIRDILKDADQFVAQSQGRMNGPAAKSRDAAAGAEATIQSIREKAAKDRQSLYKERAAAAQDVQNIQDTMYGMTGLDYGEAYRRKPELTHAQARLQTVNSDLSANRRAEADAIAKIREQSAAEVEKLSRDEQDQERITQEQWLKDQADKAQKMDEEHVREIMRLRDIKARKEAEAQQQAFDAGQHQIDVADQLQHLKIDELRLTGKLNAAEERRLQVAERFLTRSRELQKILQDPRTTAAQQRNAQEMLQKLPAEQRQADTAALAGDAEQRADRARTPRKGTATATDAGMLHGLVEQAQTRAADPASEAAAATKENTRETRRLREIMMRIQHLLEAKNVNGDRELIA